MSIYVLEKRERILCGHFMPCDDETGEWKFFKAYVKEAAAKTACIKLLSDRWNSYRVVEYGRV